MHRGIFLSLVWGGLWAQLSYRESSQAEFTRLAAGRWQQPIKPADFATSENIGRFRVGCREGKVMQRYRFTLPGGGPHQIVDEEKITDASHGMVQGDFSDWTPAGLLLTSVGQLPVFTLQGGTCYSDAVVNGQAIFYAGGPEEGFLIETMQLESPTALPVSPAGVAVDVGLYSLNVADVAARRVWKADGVRFSEFLNRIGAVSDFGISHIGGTVSVYGVQGRSNACFIRIGSWSDPMHGREVPPKFIFVEWK
ncbi:MAG: hypothetical protein N2170_09345 [Bacteroidia bacterium]|nr:hypothetical protein [Bacteroidia bacterium]